jgi:hypothetical protein
MPRRCGGRPALNESTIIVILQRYVGAIYEFMGDADMKALPQRKQAVIDLYLTTAPIKQYLSDKERGDADASVLDVREFLGAFATVLGLAGLQGPLGAASHTLANYKGDLT